MEMVLSVVVFFLFFFFKKETRFDIHLTFVCTFIDFVVENSDYIAI